MPRKFKPLNGGYCNSWKGWLNAFKPSNIIPIGHSQLTYLENESAKTCPGNFTMIAWYTNKSYPNRFSRYRKKKKENENRKGRRRKNRKLSLLLQPFLFDRRQHFRTSLSSF